MLRCIPARVPGAAELMFDAKREWLAKKAWSGYEDGVVNPTVQSDCAEVCLDPTLLKGVQWEQQAQFGQERYEGTSRVEAIHDRKNKLCNLKIKSVRFPRIRSASFPSTSVEALFYCRLNARSN